MGKRKKKYTKDGFLHTRNVPLQILASVYPKRCTLLKYLQSNDPKKSLRLFDDTTSSELKHLLTTSIVACGLQKSLVISDQDEISYDKNFSLNDIVDRVVSVICHGRGKSDNHVLSQGFCNMPYGVPEQMKLRCLFPNNMVFYVKSRTWNELHDRIGSDLMMYMLTNLSVFVKTKSSCYFQVSGCPIDAVAPSKVPTTWLSGKAENKPRSRRVKSRKVQHKLVHSNLTSIILPQQNNASGQAVCRDDGRNSKAGSRSLVKNMAHTMRKHSGSGDAKVGNFCCSSSICLPGDFQSTSQLLSTNEVPRPPVGSTPSIETPTIAFQRGESGSDVSSQSNDNVIPCSSFDIDHPHTIEFTLQGMSEKSPDVFIPSGCVKHNVTSLTTETNCKNILSSSDSFNLYNKPSHAEDHIFGQACLSADTQTLLPTNSSHTNVDMVSYSPNASQSGLDYNVNRNVQETPILNIETEPREAFSRSTKLGPSNQPSESLNTNIGTVIDEITPCQTVPYVDLTSDHDDNDGKSAEPQLKKRKVNSCRDISTLHIQSKHSNVFQNKREKRKCEDDPCKTKFKKCKRGVVENNAQRDKVRKVDSNKTVIKRNNGCSGRKPRKRKRKEKSKMAMGSKIKLLNRNIFYSTGTERFFAKKHIMETTPANVRGARLLLRTIFHGENPHVASKNSHSKDRKMKPKRLTKRLLQCEKVFLQFLTHHKSCPFKYLLNHHCPDHYHAKKPEGPRRKKNSRKNPAKRSKEIEAISKGAVANIRYSKVQ